MLAYFNLPDIQKLPRRSGTPVEVVVVELSNGHVGLLGAIVNRSRLVDRAHKKQFSSNMEPCFFKTCK